MSNADYLKKVMSKNLKYYLKRDGITQTELANKLGIPEMTMSNWLNAKTYPRVDKIQLLADYFKISRSDLTEEKQHRIFKANEYPYFPISISAGLPINVEPISSNDVETISIPDSIMGKWAGSKDIYFMRVNGESMNKIIPNNSLIAVKQMELSSFNDGDIVVYSNGCDYAVKKFYRFDDKIIFRPDSYDNSFIDYVVTNDSLEDIKIHGKVVLYIVELD
ncbi:LexA family protein [Fervidibacillus albus]|uniref:XRE family transcriptional regulator n=1 Tax=Fervidibacillus albus TaxID=2980026 RepID=A0A9E8LXX2_9BACI|nr:XRE family transcriptional regulator [Fervidibacillus albus]WAA10809.1 XRE family transcriptional regulator [Fervidibacillus albus]